MREIKFRIWNKGEGIMINYEGAGGWYIKLSGNIHDVISQDNYVIMQYTGLKDRSGREIFEGDIVLFRKNDWCNNCGTKQKKDRYKSIHWDVYGWEPFVTEGYHGTIMFDESRCEVVGNIYKIFLKSRRIKYLRNKG